MIRCRHVLQLLVLRVDDRDLALVHIHCTKEHVAHE